MPAGHAGTTRSWAAHAAQACAVPSAWLRHTSPRVCASAQLPKRCLQAVAADAQSSTGVLLVAAHEQLLCNTKDIVRLAGYVKRMASLACHDAGPAEVLRCLAVSGATPGAALLDVSGAALP